MRLFRKKYRNYYIGLGLMLMVFNFYVFDLLPACSRQQESVEAYREQVRISIEKTAKNLPMDLGDHIAISAGMAAPDTVLCVYEFKDSVGADDVDMSAFRESVIEYAKSEPRFGEILRKGRVSLIYSYEYHGREVVRCVITPDEME